MADEFDFSFIDRPEILEVLFPLAYSPFFLSGGIPHEREDFPVRTIEVEPGVHIDCGFWPAGPDFPTILYFHGNGETVAEHRWIAPYYTSRNINLFVADYRGYGTSGGRPTFASTLGDVHIIFNAFKKILSNEGYKEAIFIMGRSLGSISAVELASARQDEIRGLIVESGTAWNFRRLWGYPLPGDTYQIPAEDSPFLNRIKMRSILKPALIIHGEEDELIPVSEGRELYENSASNESRLLVISGAGHNDILAAAPEQYFNAIARFVEKIA